MTLDSGLDQNTIHYEEDDTRVSPKRPRLGGSAVKTRTTSFLEAAITIMRASDRELTTSQITDDALARGLIQTNGQTPTASMSAALYRAVKSGNPFIERVAIPGRQRAERNSVRWRLR